MRAIRLATPALVAALATVALMASAATAAPAQQDSTQQAPAEASEERGPEANLPYLFAAYSVTWVGFFVYLYYLSQKQRSLRREVETLREALEERDRRERERGPG